MAKLLTGTRIYGTGTVDTQLFVNGTNSSTSTLTGALLVAGGVGINENLTVGGISKVINSTNATTTQTAALVVAGGVGIGQDLRVGGTIYGAVNGTVIGTITTASNLAAGTAGQLVYQVGPGVSGFAGPGTAGQFLKSNGASAPTYVNTSTMYVGYAVTATDILGGVAGSIPYQQGVNDTTFLGIGTAGTILVSTGSAPTWASTASIVFGQAANVAVSNDVASTTSQYLLFASTTTGYTSLKGAATSGITYVPSTGNFGIGLADPQRKFVVRSDSVSSITAIGIYNADTATNNASVISFRSDTTGTGATAFQEFAGFSATYTDKNNATRSSDFNIFTADAGTVATKVIVKSTGNVGIGTLTPGSLLTVVGAGGSTPGTNGYLVHVGGSDNGTDPSRYMIGFSHGNSPVASNVRAGVGMMVTTGGAGNLVFETGTTAAGQLERMRITGAGNVGIGTTTTNAKLDVAGTVRISGATTILDATNATSTTTGALKVSGGIGVADNIFAGGTIYSDANFELRDNTTSTITKLAIQNQGNTVVFEIGRTDQINSPAFDFHSSGAVLDYDSRIQASGGDGSVGGGIITISAKQTAFSGTDNTTAVGNGAVKILGGLSVAQDLRIGGTFYGNVSVSGVISTATNIANGTAGQLHYQVSPGITGFAGPGTTGQFLQSNGTSAPTYVSTGTMYVGYAGNADAVKTSNDTTTATPQYITFVTTSSGYNPIKTNAGNIVYVPSTGNLGIGNANPTSKLDVTGAVRISGVTTVTNATAATAIGTGALQVSGGGSFNGDVYATGAQLDLIKIGITAGGTIDTTSGNLTLDSAGGSVNVLDNLIVSGNLTVQGTTTVVDSTVTNITDPILTLGGTVADGSAVTDDNKDRGIAFKWNNGSSPRVGFFGYDDSTGYFTFISSATITNEVVAPAGGTTRGAIDANLAGGATGSILYQSAANTTAFLNIGASGQILSVSGGLPVWTAASGIVAGTASAVTVSNDVATTTPQFITFVNTTTGSASVKGSAMSGLNFIPSSGNLGLGVNTPAAKIDISSVALTSHGLQISKSFAGGGDGYAAANIFGTDSGIGNTGITVAKKGTGGFSAADGFVMQGLYNGSAVLSLTSAGNLGLGTTTPGFTLDLNTTGSIRAGGRSRQEFTRTITGVAGDTVAIGTLSNNSIGQTIKIRINGHNGGAIDAQTFEISMLAYAGYANALGWLELPHSSWTQGWTGTYGYTVDVYRPDSNLASAPTYFRIRNKTGVGAGLIYVNIEYDSDSTLTSSTAASNIATTFNASTAPAGGSVGGFYGALEWYWPVTGSSTASGGYNAAQGGLFVANSGAVGVGTITPSGVLQVVKNQNAETTVNITNTTAGTASRTRLIMGSDGSAGNLSVGMHSSSFTSYANEGWVWTSGASTPLVFATVGTPRMRVDVNGYVTIGNSSSVHGSSGRGTLEVNGSSNSIIANTVGGASAGYLYHDGTNYQLVNTKTGSFSIYTSNTLRLWVDNAGRITGGYATPVRLDSKIRTDNNIAWTWQDSVENGGTGMITGGGTAGTTSTYNSAVVPFSKAMTFNVYYESISDEFIPILPGETFYGELWAYRANGAAGTAGGLYAGIATYDKDKRPIDANNGLNYFVSSNQTVPTTGVWTKYSGTYTAPLTHTIYSGSDGGPVRYIKPYLIVNYPSGTIPTSISGYFIRRRDVLRDTGDTFINGITKINNNTNATSTITGALQVINGGAGIGGNLYVGGTIYGTVSGSISNSTNVAVTNDTSSATAQYLTFVSGTSGNLPIKVDSGELVFVPSTGRIGIGTNAPTQKLHVAGAGQVADYFRITNTGGAQRLLMGNQDSGGANNPNAIVAANGTMYFGNGNSWTDGGGTVTYTANLSTTGLYLGAGNNAAGAKLHIFNSTPASAAAVPTGTDLLIDSSTNSYLTFRQSSDAGIYGGMQWVDNNTGAYIVFRNNTASGTSVGSDSLIYGTYQDHIFQTGSSGTINGRTETVRFKGNGNVGIGTLNAGVKLSVYNSTNQPNGANKPGSVLQLGQYSSSTNEGPAIDFNLRWNGAYEDTNLSTGWVGGRIAGVYDSSASNGGALVFHTNGGTGASGGANSAEVTEKMRIRPDGNVGIGTTTPSYKLQVNGSFAATTKSFVIDHPTKPGMQLRYGSLEGPENGVYVRGRLKGTNTIELPDYWTKLVDPDSITVTLTPVGKHQKLFVEDIADNKVVVGNDGLFAKGIDCFYTVWAERADVEKLQVEI